MRHLAGHEAGLSFAELRAASGLTTESLRAELDTGLRDGLIRRIGAGNGLRYLCNAVTPSREDGRAK